MPFEGSGPLDDGPDHTPDVPGVPKVPHLEMP